MVDVKVSITRETSLMMLDDKENQKQLILKFDQTEDLLHFTWGSEYGEHRFALHTSDVEEFQRQIKLMMDERINTDVPCKT